ncbi:MAG: DNA alkylation repair protein [Candidatus Magasanikbacteria bacterium]|nr:DNA alkylation repair protein [Candidatus Magasanikbacteria bacterium]
MIINSMPRFIPIQKKLRQMAKKEKALTLARFFKTGPGQYAEGDKFLGVVVPQIRSLVKKNTDLSLKDILKLVHSPFHEERLLGLLIMVAQYPLASQEKKQQLFKMYIKNTRYINNWDLVDLTAEHIVGAYLEKTNKKIIWQLAKSSNLWEKRIAILSTFKYIKKGQPDLTLSIAKELMRDKHDLIHKAIGWMLREVGKRCSQAKEEEFLSQYGRLMPRTALRYAIERLPTSKKKYFMNLKPMK